MNLVVDANVIAGLVLPLAFSEQATRRVREWKRAGGQLLAPVLLEYEMAAVLRKAVVSGWLTTGGAVAAMDRILALHIQCVPPTLELHERALRWADRLGQSKTYDAHYMALAEQRDVDLWTADRRLSNAARQAGATWVYWIGQDEV